MCKKQYFHPAPSNLKNVKTKEMTFFNFRRVDRFQRIFAVETRFEQSTC